MTKSVGGEINYNHNGSKIKSLFKEGLQRLIKKLRALHFWLLEQDKTFNQGQKCWHIRAKQPASFRNFKRRLFCRYIALSIFNVEICSFDTVSGYNIEKVRQGRNEKIGDWKPHAFIETGQFPRVPYIVWIIFYTVWSFQSIITALSLSLSHIEKSSLLSST